MKRPTKYRSKSSKSRIPGEVGYGRPPKYTRFKPGQSGNPSGRPGHKASTKASGESVGALLSKILKEKLKLREGERLIDGDGAGTWLCLQRAIEEADNLLSLVPEAQRPSLREFRSYLEKKLIKMSGYLV
jgi:hypothetical protein